MEGVDCVRPANPSPNGQSDVQWREASPTALETTQNEAPPTIRGHQGPNCGSPSRSSSTTWDSLLNPNAVMALPQPDTRPLGPPLLNLAVVCPLE
ncbi:hypothetical protein JOQ06_010691 [Pogonophryne albipinna]|uniref:Uncharacterized protein n=1 Tax=Pogonophryne albipinna TaxID=1090488 RepID=A0AAD6AUF9_9TELE|nr:hypothetical protein JOQ06_010691 [Pogonophryne albipinna]